MDANNDDRGESVGDAISMTVSQTGGLSCDSVCELSSLGVVWVRDSLLGWVGLLMQPSPPSRFSLFGSGCTG